MHSCHKKLCCLNYLIKYSNNRLLSTVQETLKKYINIRWMFDAKSWEPTEAQIRAISSFIQPEEKERISKFMFLKDAKSSLIGRLMIRKYLSSATGIPYKDIKIGRNDSGKPFLVGSNDSEVDFSVSHQADLVVFAGNTQQKVGVDVMNTEPPINKDVSKLFHRMKRWLTDMEWDKIHSYKTEADKLTCFYRIWCLKESYLKNLGLGVASISLKSLNFSIHDELSIGKIITSTKLYENNKVKDLIFEETMIDDRYIVAVAVKDIKSNSTAPYTLPFSFITIEELLKDAQPLNNSDQHFVSDFFSKKEKPY